jgi:O-antigen/teichoic acid export membrane protein
VNGGSLLALFLIRGNPVAIRLSCTFGIELILFILFSGYLFRKMVAVFNRNMMLKSLKLGVPIMVSAIFGIVVNFSDKFLLQRYGSLADLSNYYLAFSFAAIIPLIFASLQNVWLPVFLQEKDVEKNFHKTTKLLVKLAWIFVSISIAIWLLFYILLWLKFIPAKYGDVTWILPILLMTQIFASLTPIFSNYLVYFEKTSYVSLSGLIVSLVSISLGLWLIPLWGVLGAEITTLIVNVIYLAIYYYLVLFLKLRYLTVRQNFQA